MERKPKVHVVGGGLAGVEAAYQCLRRGIAVDLHEMRPVKSTPAHKTGDLAELVCSNSFKSIQEESAPGQLKKEMTLLDSLVIKSAYGAQVPAGQALAVDRLKFSAGVAASLEAFANFRRIGEEVTSLPSLEACEKNNEWWIMATGPLTSEPLGNWLLAATERAGQHLYFYDAIAPMLDTDSIKLEEGFWANRWKEEEAGDYFNIPLTKDEYLTLIEDILAAEKMPLHDFEKPCYFESCLPIEVLAERGVDTLRFGPMKPVGLRDPRTGRFPYAAIQLRQENEQGSMLSMVGFQTKMKWPEQKRVFSKLPALAEVEFFRHGSVHRNTYIEGPKVLAADLSLRHHPRVFLAGQITGVEGYTESAAMGLLAGTSAAYYIQGENFALPPESSMLGALAHYITKGVKGAYQPMNAHFGLLPGIERKRGVSKKDAKAQKCFVAQQGMEKWLAVQAGGQA